VNYLRTRKRSNGSATVLTLVNSRFQNRFGIPFCDGGVWSGASPRTPEIFLAWRRVFNDVLEPSNGSNLRKSLVPRSRLPRIACRNFIDDEMAFAGILASSSLFAAASIRGWWRYFRWGHRYCRATRSIQPRSSKNERFVRGVLPPCSERSSAPTDELVRIENHSIGYFAGVDASAYSRCIT